MSYGRPAKTSSSLDSHLSSAVGVICDAFGPSTSSSVLLHHTEKGNDSCNHEEDLRVVSKLCFGIVQHKKLEESFVPGVPLLQF